MVGLSIVSVCLMIGGSSNYVYLFVSLFRLYRSWDMEMKIYMFKYVLYKFEVSESWRRSLRGGKNCCNGDNESYEKQQGREETHFEKKKL